MKRVLSLIFVLLLCLTVLLGCKKSADTDDTVQGTVATSEIEGADDIGDYNFGGADFTILTRKETSYEHIGAVGNEGVSQAVYSRNLAVSERFGVNIKTVEMVGAYDDHADYVTAVRAEHMSSSGAYDLLSTHSVYLGWLGQEGILADLSKLPEIDFTKAYWNQNLYNELNIDGSCYIMIGDIGHTTYEYMSVMFVNTTILEENQLVANGINGLYDMVDVGKWTWEAMFNMSKAYGLGEHTGNVDTDKYGLLFNPHAMRAGLVAQEASVYQRNDDGRFIMPAEASEHLVNSVLNLSRFFAQPNMYFPEGVWNFGQTELNPKFISGRALFYGQILGESKNFATDMGEGYAVLPLPKYDEFQGNYYTICADEVSAVAIMENTENKEMSGVVTQALALYGSQYVTPEYYEKALKYRYANDPRCPEILEKIRASLTIEAVPTFYETGIDSDMFANIVRLGESEGIASRYAEYSTSGNTQLETFYTSIDILRG